MLAVVDTNVWVSAFLTPGGTAAKLLDAVKRGRLIPAFSGAIEAEYREVLSRRKFAIDPQVVAEFFERLLDSGRRVESAAPVPVPLPDPDDEPFIAVARQLGCPIVAGNARHFPAGAGAGVEVVGPGEFLARLMPTGI